VDEVKGKVVRTFSMTELGESSYCYTLSYSRY